MNTLQYIEQKYPKSLGRADYPEKFTELYTQFYIKSVNPDPRVSEIAEYTVAAKLELESVNPSKLLSNFLAGWEAGINMLHGQINTRSPAIPWNGDA